MNMIQLKVMPESKGLRISEHQIPTAAKILARGFVDDPMFCFIFPKSETRLQALEAFFELFVADGIKRGEVILDRKEQGACIWYPPEVSVFDEQFEEMLGEIISIASRFGGLESAERFEQLANQVGVNEPTVSRCEVLWIALLPEARGKGIGSSLLLPALNKADTKKVGCYLVSSNPRNISFYERHGFRKNCLIQVSDTYSMMGMWRDFVEE
jgi:ribosomal protein S18 acetylase RimI-like enzyme